MRKDSVLWLHPDPLLPPQRDGFHGLRSEPRLSCVIPRSVCAISLPIQERGLRLGARTAGLRTWYCPIWKNSDKMPAFWVTLLEIPLTFHRNCHTCVHRFVVSWCGGRSGKGERPGFESGSNTRPLEVGARGQG